MLIYRYLKIFVVAGYAMDLKIYYIFAVKVYKIFLYLFSEFIPKNLIVYKV